MLTGFRTVFKRIDRFLWTRVLGDSPQFQEGDQVFVADHDLRVVLGDDLATVVDRSYQFYHWEYQIVPNDPNPDRPLATRVADFGTWATAKMIEPIDTPKGR